MAFSGVGSSLARDSPTFFEMLAAERLMNTLQDAISYGLSVYGQRSEVCRRLLENEDDLFFLIRVILESHALKSYNASFAEHVYGLRRVPYGRKAPPQEEKKKTDKGVLLLTNRQKHLSVILMTLAPFLRAKLMKMYTNYSSNSTDQHSNNNNHGATVCWKDVLDALWKRRHNSDDRKTHYYRNLMDTIQMCCRQHAKRLCVKAVPWLHTSAHMVDLCYKLLYLLQKSPYYSPAHHFIGIRVAQLSADDVARTRHEKMVHRQSILDSIQKSTAPLPFKLLRTGSLKIKHYVSDHTTTALILAVFGFKVLEWWYTTAEEQAQGASLSSLPVPVPPPAIPPIGGMYALPKDCSLCAICQKKRKNPTMVSHTGYVFCYPCVFKHVSEQGVCPVTGLVTDISDLRRLYDGMASSGSTQSFI
ncbi:hypothetical protein M9435_003319 [Picochlorum sp. BPE23]|nr:hypothetical protein M9435_003319 [Picochlorum sp. BPE23]